MADAACQYVPAEIFHVEKGESTAEAKSVCAGCPVRNECLLYALDNEERYGVYGGLSERERHRLTRSGWRSGDPIPDVHMPYADTGVCPECGRQFRNVSRHREMAHRIRGAA